MSRLGGKHRLAVTGFQMIGFLCMAVGAQPLRADNLAAGRELLWNRAPNYARCMDPGDAAQLTDGKRARNDYIWIDTASVGWEIQVGDIVTWSMDLGAECVLDSVVLSTSWFERTGVVPPSLLCAAGPSSEQLFWAGALDAGTLTRPDPTHPARLRLVVPLHGMRGRQLLIAAQLRSAFFGTDEIEVRGSRAPAAPAYPAADAGLDAPGCPLGRSFAVGEIDAVFAVQRRFWAMRTALGAASGTETDRDVMHDRDERGDVSAAMTPGSGMSALQRPAFAAERTLLAARARDWRSLGAPRMAVRRVDPWAPTTPWSEPQAAIDDTMEVWPGAWAAATVEIVAAGEDSVSVALGIPAAPAGAPRLVLREVTFVESRDGRWAGDALPLAAESLAVGPGSVRQVWIDVDARDAVPGTYELAIEAGGRRVPLPVRVHDVTPLPATLSALTWTYPRKFGLTRAAPEAAVRDNREHGIDTWVLPEESVPWPDPATIDDHGELRAPLDFSVCTRDLDLLDGVPVHRLVWYWDFNPRADDPSRGRFRHPYGSDAWCRAVSAWLDAWQAHLEARGFTRAQTRMQPVDEAAGPAVEKLYGLLRSLRPDLQLALTLTRNATPGQLRALEPHLALAIVERRALEKNASWLARARQRGIEVWTYDVLEPSKTTPPQSGYRVLPWLAWAQELSGCSFWAYGDTGLHSADAWNDFDGSRWDYSVVYGEAGAPRSLGDAELVPSKRWQAFRMGLQETSLLGAALPQEPDLRRWLRRELHASTFDPDVVRRRLLRWLE